MVLNVEERIKMAYTAGMIDGDGAIYLQTKKNWSVPVIQIAVSSLDLVKYLFDNFGGTISKSRNLPCWALRKKKESIDFLKKISHFLVEKQGIALSALEGKVKETMRLNKWTCQEEHEQNLGFKSDEEIWAYIAGFIDADGHITIKKRNRDSIEKKRCYPDYSLEIGCGGTDFRSTSFIAKFFGKGSLKLRPHRLCVNGKRLDFRVTKHEEVKQFLSKCLPFLIIKKTNAEIALQYIDGYFAKMGGNDRSIDESQIQHRENCYQQMKLLQRRK